jgi:hypothetical protein
METPPGQGPGIFVYHGAPTPTYFPPSLREGIIVYQGAPTPIPKELEFKVGPLPQLISSKEYKY